jgi:hypothetical protein
VVAAPAPPWTSLPYDCDDSMIHFY